MGQLISAWHLRHATKAAGGLCHLDAQSAEGRAYLADVAWAVHYADAGRRLMVEAASSLIRRLFTVSALPGSLIACDHNHVRREEHFGESFWVHRKGANAAGSDEPGIIPGSMGTRSFHVVGRGCAESLRSSSHGAGRAMSRHDARRRISPRRLAAELDGVWVDERVAPRLREEAPSAYKDIDKVLRAQSELIRVVRRLRPVLCYKGV